MVTDSRAEALAGRLRFSMTDDEITDEVTKEMGSTVVELRRETEVTTVVISIAASMVEPTQHVCYRFTLRRGDDITYEKATGCTAVPTS